MPMPALRGGGKGNHNRSWDPGGHLPPTSLHTQSRLPPHPIGPALRGKGTSPAWPPLVAKVTEKVSLPRPRDVIVMLMVGGEVAGRGAPRFNSHLPGVNPCRAQPQSGKFSPLGSASPTRSPSILSPKHPGSSAPVPSGSSHPLPRLLGVPWSHHLLGVPEPGAPSLPPSPGDPSVWTAGREARECGPMGQKLGAPPHLSCQQTELHCGD